MDRKLLELLACPTTRQPLQPADAGTLRRLNDAIARGETQRCGGEAQTSPVEAALVTADGRLLYRIDDGIPVLLAEEAIEIGTLSTAP